LGKWFFGELHMEHGEPERRTTASTPKRILQHLNRRLIFEAPLAEPDFETFTRPKNVEHWTFNLHGQSVDRIIIYLRSDVGCEYGIKTGGCTSCRHFRLGTAGKRLDIPDMYVKQTLAAIQQHGLPPVVCIYNEGNMLNEWELPQDQLLAIVRHLTDNGVKRLVLESRPEYITDQTLAKVTGAAGDMEIEVGIGLESQNDFIRDELFLKSTPLKAYERSVARLKDFGIRSLAYVIIKPAFLNEAQAIADAIQTARYAFEVGTDAISFEPIGVEPHTVTDLMYQAGLFKPAWLWSVIRVTEETYHLGEVRIGGFQFEPLPVTLPRNCDVCTDRVIEAINRYNLTYDLSLLTSQHCGNCFSSYRNELSCLSAEIYEEDLKAELINFVGTHRSPIQPLVRLAS
jgi:archaeosine synthase beta-subunit